MEKSKKIFIIVIALIVLLVFLFLFFFNQKGLTPKDEEQQKQEESSAKEEFTKYFLSLVDGRVSIVGEDYFLMNVNVAKEVDENESAETETISVKVKITNQTEFVDSNDFKFVEIPQEYQQGLLAFDYIKNVVEGNYEIAVYIDIMEDISQEGIIDGGEVTAKYISWSCFPEGEF
jgi:hypothetical protein